MRTLIFVLFICLHNFISAQETFTSVSIEDVVLDSTVNVRALEISDSKIIIATSDARVMIKEKDQGKFELFSSDTLFKPNFRSLAITKEGVFSLGIASPALLYKNGNVVYREDNEKAFYDAMTFWNEKEGIAMGDPTEDCISIIITRDGGETWKKVECKNLPEAVGGEAAFAASDTNIKTIGNHTWIATGGMASRILYSANKGKSWQVYDTPIIQGTPTTGMYSVDFYDEQVGIAIGGDYTKPEAAIANKIKTKDGGKTWSVLADGLSPGYRSCVQFVPGSAGKGVVAIGFKGIDYSSDGGETWMHLSDEGFYTLRFMDGNTAYAGGNGRVSKLVFK
ncbi:WD40/YVTN/BNR-like repeat-containing protein [Portibacter lacus]|uniref:Oxidoreductase n=1 Tax=Portibacter lacus TaxID=1099794 RepID=A0AA37SNE0_9BACT|nr:oxidoreductase [Portibacter lacus]GLR17836.1 hypothetical protein GCM10007940_24510 [Portibacter lacus]